MNRQALGPPPLDWPQEADPALYDMYAKALLEPGWAGDIDDAEATYVAYHVSRSATLRTKWRVKEVFGKRWRRISPAMAEGLAAWWLEMIPFVENGVRVSGTKAVGPEPTHNTGRRREAVRS